MGIVEDYERELRWKRKDYQAYSDFLQSWQWEWFAHLTFWNDEKPFHAKKSFISWIRQLCIGEGIQVGAFYGISYVSGHPHIHALLFGRGKTLNGIKGLIHVDPSKWERNWPHISKIENIRSKESSARYVSKHFLRNDYFEPCFYNVKLLKKLKDH